MAKVPRSAADMPGAHVPERILAQVEDALAIAAEDADEAGARGYVSQVFTQVSLPYRDPAKTDPSATRWVRRNGDFTLIVDPDIGPKGESLFPFGKYPRLILPWLTTQIIEAEREGAARIGESLTLPLGNSLRAFMASLGQEVGGRQGVIVRDQTQRLFSARFNIKQAGQTETGYGVRAAQFSVARGYELWWGKDGGEDQSGLWGSSVTLSADFVADTLACPIPIDLRALAHLAKAGPMAMDIYQWMNYRLPNAKRETLIDWEVLNWQFGGQYARARAFKAQFVAQLAAVHRVYPQARFEVYPTGLLIKPSPPAITRHRRHITDTAC